MIQTIKTVRPEMADFHLAGESIAGAMTAAAASGKSLQHALIPPEDFYKASFPKIELIESHIIGSNFREANLRRAVLTHCVAVEACFVGADLYRLKSIRGDFSRCYFSDSNLRKAEISKSYFHEGAFDGADLREVVAHLCKFTKVGLEDADFEGADLSGSVFAGCDLDNVAFKGAKLTGCDFRSSSLDGADFYGAILDPDTVDGIQMPGAHFVGASMVGVKGIALDRTTPLASLYIQPGKIRAYVKLAQDSVPLNPGDELVVNTEAADAKKKNDVDFYIRAIYLNHSNENDNIYMIETEAANIVDIPFGSDGVFYVNKATIVEKVDQQVPNAC